MAWRWDFGAGIWARFLRPVLARVQVRFFIRKQWTRAGSDLEVLGSGGVRSKGVGLSKDVADGAHERVLSERKLWICVYILRNSRLNAGKRGAASSVSVC